MGNETEIVFFNHGGRKVSNDPRWQAKNSLKQMKKKAEPKQEEDEDPRSEEVTVTPVDHTAEETMAPGDQGVEDDLDPDAEDDDDSEDDEDSEDNSDDDSEDEDDEESEVEVKDYSDLTGKELKKEVTARREAGRTISTKGVTTKAELAALLQADDAASAEES